MIFPSLSMLAILTEVLRDFSQSLYVGNPDRGSS